MPEFFGWGRGLECSYHWLILLNLQQKAGGEEKSGQSSWFYWLYFSLNPLFFGFFYFKESFLGLVHVSKKCIINRVPVVDITDLYSGKWRHVHPFIFFPALLPRKHKRWFVCSSLITTESLFFNQDQCVIWTQISCLQPAFLLHIKSFHTVWCRNRRW